MCKFSCILYNFLSEYKINKCSNILLFNYLIIKYVHLILIFRKMFFVFLALSVLCHATNGQDENPQNVTSQERSGKGIIFENINSFQISGINDKKKTFYSLIHNIKLGHLMKDTIFHMLHMLKLNRENSETKFDGVGSCDRIFLIFFNEKLF